MKNNLTKFVLPHDAHWAIEEGAGMMLWQMLKGIDARTHQAEYAARRADLPMMPDENDQEAQRSKPYSMRGGVAIISMVGPMTKAPTSMDSGCSTVDIRRQVRQATADMDVQSTILRIDSPGGSVAGTQSLADDIAAAAKQKPFNVFYEDCGCSAALWAGSQARACYANETAMVGSMGTGMVVYDASKAFADAGIECLVFKSGELKLAGEFGSQITDAQRAQFQSRIDALTNYFKAAVMSGRNMSRAKVDALFTGGVWIGEEAASNGLIDGITTLDALVSSMMKGTAKPRGRAAASAGFVAGQAIADALIPTDAEIEEHVTATLGIPLQTTYFSSNDDDPLAGSTLEHTLDSALAAVAEGTARAKKVQALRSPQGRTLGQERLSQLRVLHAELTVLLSECASISTTATTDLPVVKEPTAEQKARSQKAKDILARARLTA